MKIKAVPGASTAPAQVAAYGGDRTRDAVARLIVEGGPQTAQALANRLGLSPAAIRRHLDALVTEGMLSEREPRRSSRRGRGRPARVYVVTDSGRNAFGHAYDELATSAIRHLRGIGGDDELIAFADERAAALEHDLASVAAIAEPLARAGALAAALTERGYAAGLESGAAPGVDGVQICQHHCPIAHVAQQFPQLCEAETRAFERLLGTYVQRLATIAHGDGVCTTHIPLAAPHHASIVASSIPARTGSRP